MADKLSRKDTLKLLAELVVNPQPNYSIKIKLGGWGKSAYVLITCVKEDALGTVSCKSYNGEWQQALKEAVESCTKTKSLEEG